MQVLQDGVMHVYSIDRRLHDLILADTVLTRVLWELSFHPALFKTLRLKLLHESHSTMCNARFLIST